MRFEINSRREISGGVFAGIPISRNAEFVGNRLFKTELSAGARRRRNDVFRKVITAAGDARLCFESFAHLRVSVIADVIRPVANRNKHVVADDDLYAVFLAVVNAPFNRWNKRRRIRSRINIAGDVKTNFNITACADDDARHEARKFTDTSGAVKSKRRVEFKINFAFVQNVRRRHVKNCLLGICNDGKRQNKK